jgi:hypothetical protein
MHREAIQIRFAKRYCVLIGFLAALGLSGLFANPARSELVQLDVVGTVRFAGCPYDGNCWLYPLMWDVPKGESMTLRVVYDSEVPLSGDYSEADYYYAEYDHAIPLESPLGMEISFGPYAISVGSNGAPAEYYWIGVFDVINAYPNFPDIQESIHIQIDVPPGSVILPGPPGFHDLEFQDIYYNFSNLSSDFLVGPSIPAGFPLFDWELVQLVVEVYDPIYARLGFVFMNIDQVTLTTLPEPSVRLGVLAGAALLGLLQRRQRSKRRRSF